MKRNIHWLLAALAMTGVAGGVMGATSDSSPSTTGTATPAAPQHHWHRHGPGMMAGGLMRALHQLNLTAAQQQMVHQIVASARTQARAQLSATAGGNFAVLGNPGDPNYAAALQAAKDRAAARIQAASDVELSIYNTVLTPEQKAQLPQVLASIQARMQQHAHGNS